MLFSHRPTGYRDFKLSDKYLDSFKDTQPNWGYGDLSYIVFKRTYARQLPDGSTEEFWQTVKRVVDGTYNTQKIYCASMRLPWSNEKAQRSAQTMYKLMWEFKFLPAGRGLWNMGQQHIYERGSAPLNSCAFISTEDIKNNYADPFTWCMDMSMLGVGVGYDTLGRGSVRIIEPKVSADIHTVDDSREGWCRTLERLLNAYVGKETMPKEWDYSHIRKAGAPLKTFGGVSSGAQPLIDMVNNLTKLYISYIGQAVDSALIVDTFNFSGKCVVSGGIRRTSQIAFGDIDDELFITLKSDPAIVEDRRFASNNSISATVGMDYHKAANLTGINGEPGYFWLENAQAYGRMIDGRTYKDYRVRGTNPCGEQSLEPGEMCNLVETFPANHDTLEEYKLTLKFAYLYGKTVTLIPCHDPRTNAIQMRNRRIGLSQSGVIQSFNKHGRRTHLQWCDESYKYIVELDKIYSEWLCIPESIKKTSIKPSGTVSLLAGATPGQHYPQSPYYIRRVRIANTSKFLPLCRAAGYVIEKDAYADNTWVVEFPMQEKHIVRGKIDVTMWEQLENAAALQEYWADNQVSATITVQPHEIDSIENALTCFEDRLKGVSFLPLTEHGYKQAPYETITKEQYDESISHITPIGHLKKINTHEKEDKFCDGEYCGI